MSEIIPNTNLLYRRRDITETGYEGGSYSPIISIGNQDDVNDIVSRLLPILDTFFTHVRDNTDTEIIINPTDKTVINREEILMLPYSPLMSGSITLDERNTQLDTIVSEHLYSKYSDWKYELSVGIYDRRVIIIRGKQREGCVIF